MKATLPTTKVDIKVKHFNLEDPGTPLLDTVSAEVQLYPAPVISVYNARKECVTCTASIQDAANLIVKAMEFNACVKNASSATFNIFVNGVILWHHYFGQNEVDTFSNNFNIMLCDSFTKVIAAMEYEAYKDKKQQAKNQDLSTKALAGKLSDILKANRKK